MMRLTRQYAYGFLAAVPDEDKLAMYYELERLNEIFAEIEGYIAIVDFRPE